MEIDTERIVAHDGHCRQTDESRYIFTVNIHINEKRRGTVTQVEASTRVLNRRVVIDPGPGLKSEKEILNALYEQLDYGGFHPTRYRIREPAGLWNNWNETGYEGPVYKRSLEKAP